MNDQATKLRAIIDQQMKLNSESKELSKQEKGTELVSDSLLDSNPIHPESQSNKKEVLKDQVLEADSLEQEGLNISDIAFEQAQKSIAIKQKEIGILAIASNHLMSMNASFVVKLGVQLQRLGKNVCIIDVEGSLFNHLNQAHHCPTLTDVINQKSTLSEALIDGPQHIKLMKSGDLIFNQTLNEEALNQQLNLLSEIDLILIHTDTNVSRVNMISFILAQELVLISMPDVATLKDTYSLLKIINSYQFKSVVRMLFERVPNVQEAQKGFQLITELTEHFLEIKISSLGDINSKVSEYESSQSFEEIRVLADHLQRLPLLRRQQITIKDVINNLIRLCS